MIKSAKNTIKNSTVLITGGTGSFGTTVVGQLLPLRPKKVIIFSRDEKKQYDMRHFYDNALLRFVIGDVRDKESVLSAMEGVNYVFHAAAMKQVPTCEFFPEEAIKTNVLGTQHVIQAAVYHKVKRVIALSTDKAVYPINVLGQTKALMEKLILATARRLVENGNKQTILSCVRYGNVLYTRGSILPHFMQQLIKNEPLLLTDASMTRFLLPLPQAIDLVFYALSEGENGHIYVRKSPAATVETLAQAFCEIFAYKKGWKEVGVRAGEKMHETLVTREERTRCVEKGNYFHISPETQGLDYNKYFVKGRKHTMQNISSFTSDNAQRLGVSETKRMLELVPEIQERLHALKK